MVCRHLLVSKTMHWNHWNDITKNDKLRIIYSKFKMCNFPTVNTDIPNNLSTNTKIKEQVKQQKNAYTRILPKPTDQVIFLSCTIHSNVLLVYICFFVSYYEQLIVKTSICLNTLYCPNEWFNILNYINDRKLLLESFSFFSFFYFEGFFSSKRNKKCQGEYCTTTKDKYLIINLLLIF